MTKEDYNQLFDGLPAVVKFGAGFCQPCKIMDKTLDRLVPQFPNIHFIHVDVEDSPELAQEFQITNIPVTLFVKSDGEIVNRKVGLLPEKAIVAEIENLLNS